MHDLLRHLHFAPELAVEFQAVFSRLEYALKVSGFASGGEEKVNANWDLFANTVDAAFLALDDASLVEARDYLLQHPPRKQVLVDKVVRFADQSIDPNQRQTQQVLRLVRTVWNNLFHNGKFLPDGEQEPGRNERLVLASLRVLRACSTLDARVRMSFEH